MATAAPQKGGAGRIKSLDSILATAEKKSLKRSLGAFQLTLLGIGAVIGTGIFVLTATAAQKAGPGMAQTVQLLGTLVHDPRLIVLDEPFSGLDPINQGKLERLIRERAANGVTVIFSTHGAALAAHRRRNKAARRSVGAVSQRGRRRRSNNGGASGAVVSDGLEPASDIRQYHRKSLHLWNRP